MNKEIFKAFHKSHKFYRGLEGLGLEISKNDLSDALDILEDLCTDLMVEYIKSKLIVFYNSPLCKDAELTLLGECSDKFEGDDNDFMDYVFEAALNFYS